MKNKQKVIGTLVNVIDSLERDYIHYEWIKQSSCNCGVVAQAALNINRTELDILRTPFFKKLETLNKDKKVSDKGYIDVTWKNAIKWLCPITGKSGFEIINDLENSGFHRSDLTHLEFLDNPIILKLSKIEKVDKIKKVFVSNEISFVKKTSKVKSSNLLKRLFFIKDIKEFEEKVETPIYNEIKVKEYEDNYFAKKGNLILYLKAWLSILKNEIGNNEELNKKDKLQFELVNAIAEENYEQAAKLRDELSII